MMGGGGHGQLSELDRLRVEVRELREELEAYRANEVVDERSLAAQMQVLRMRMAFGREVSPCGARMLMALLKRPGVLVTRATLYPLLSPTGEEQEVPNRTLLVQVCRLRKALTSAGFPGAILSEFSIGYRIPAETALTMQQRLDAVRP